MILSAAQGKHHALVTLIRLLVFLPALAVVFRSPGDAVPGARAQGNCATFPETGHMVCGRFLEYWRTNGGLPQFGYPISQEFVEKSDLNDADYLVQYFERAVFEHHPENQAPYDVLLSQLGTYLLRQKYPNGTSAQNTPIIPAAGGTILPTPIPAVKGEEVIVGQDVVMTLIDQVQAAITRVQTGHCGTEMTWVLQTSNQGTATFVVDLDKASLEMVDSTGKWYPLSPACGALPYSGSFSEPIALIPGDIHKGYVAFDAADIPPGATYLDLHMVLSGSRVAFRYYLP